MSKQKRVIKTLLIILSVQFNLFIGYYLYSNFIEDKINSKQEVPFTLSSTNYDTPLPKSVRLDKPIIVKKRVITKEKKEDPEKKLEEQLKRIAPNSSQDIVTIDSKLVKPILYTNSVSLSTLTVSEKKQKFIDMMIPSILVAKHQLNMDRKKVAELVIKESKKGISDKEEQWLRIKRKEFRANNNYELYKKMKPHPTSIIIAQAIVESGWGTSKFFQKANNVFGIWSFSSTDNRMAASKKRGAKTIYLKKYTSMEESIYDYFTTLTKDCYKEFQEKRLKTDDPFKLVNHLLKYSERGPAYIKDLKNMMKDNKLVAYDSYRLDL